MSILVRWLKSFLLSAGFAKGRALGDPLRPRWEAGEPIQAEGADLTTFARVALDPPKTASKKHSAPLQKSARPKTNLSLLFDCSGCSQRTNMSILVRLRKSFPLNARPKALLRLLDGDPDLTAFARLAPDPPKPECFECSHVHQSAVLYVRSAKLVDDRLRLRRDDVARPRAGISLGPSLQGKSNGCE